MNHRESDSGRTETLLSGVSGLLPLRTQVEGPSSRRGERIDVNHPSNFEGLHNRGWHSFQSSWPHPPIGPPDFGTERPQRRTIGAQPRILAAINSTRLRPSSTPGSLPLSRFVRHN